MSADARDKKLESSKAEGREGRRRIDWIEKKRLKSHKSKESKRESTAVFFFVLC